MKPAVVAPRPSRPSLGFARRRSSVSHVAAVAPRGSSIEELGLFLRDVLPHVSANDPETVHAVERMAEDGAEPSSKTLEALLLQADAIVTRLVAMCPPSHLCVLLDILRILGDRPTRVSLAPLGTAPPPLDHAIAATSDIYHSSVAPQHRSTPFYAQLHEQLQTAVQAAADARNELQQVFDEDPSVLRPIVIAELVTARHCQRAARLLLTESSLATSLSWLCVQELHEMAATGRCVASTTTQELSSPGCQAALATAFQLMSDTKVDELNVEMSRAATASVDSDTPTLASDVLALWTVLHSAMRACGRQQVFGFGSPTPASAALDAEVAPDIEEIEIDVDDEVLDEGVAQKLRRKQESAKQFAMGMQRLMQSSSLAAVAFTQRTLSELTSAAQHGAQLSHETLADLTTHWDHVLQVMALENVRETAMQLQQLVQEQQEELLAHHWRDLLGRTQRAAAESARAVEMSTTQAMDFYNARRMSVKRVVQGLEEKTAAHRREAKAVGDKWWQEGSTKIDDGYDDVVRNARHAAHATKETLSGFKWIMSKMPSLAKLEILRDFAQVMGLVFTNMYTVALVTAPEKVNALQRRLNWMQAVLRGIYNFFAADFTAMLLRYSGSRVEIVPDALFALLIFFILLGCAGLLLLITAVVFRLDRHDSGHSKSHTGPFVQRIAVWYRRAFTIQRVTIVLTLCQSVHLPIARLCMEILVGTEKTSSVHRRYSGKWFWKHLYGWAIALLASYVPGLILLLLVLIKRNAPAVKSTDKKATTTWRETMRQYCLRASKSHHLKIRDLDGTMVPFHNSVYARILENDPRQLQCPYRSLYASFERRWQYYKVVQLTMKLALTMLLILIPDARVGGLITVGVTFLSFLSTLTAPFIDNFDDKLEFSAKFTALVTCIGGVLIVYDPRAENGSTRGYNMFVNIVNIVNGVIMVTITCFGMEQVKLGFKRLWGQLTFSDSRRYAVEKPASKVLPAWDVEYEIRHRVWHAFWKRQLLSLGEHEAIKRLAEGRREEERAAALAKKSKADLVASERKTLAQREHWIGQANECVAAVRLLLRGVLEGPDVYYEPASKTKDGGFGRLTIIRYPFCCEFQLDDSPSSEKIQIVNDRDVATLLFTNFRCDVARRRLVRQKLRALSEWGQAIELPFEREETPSSRDASLSSMTASSATTLRCRYSRGVIRVHASDTLSDSSGFRLSITYCDGMGKVVSTETNEVVECVINRSAVVEGDEALALLGLTRRFDESTTFDEILSRPDVADAVVRYLPRIQATQRGEREHRLHVQQDHDAVLGSGFRFVVYNNPHITRHNLERYLADHETNAQLQKLAITRRAALDLLYEKLGFIYSDPRTMFWYVFWHDVFEQNRDAIPQIEASKLALDPEAPTSIVYERMPREALQPWLERRGLWGERRLCGLRWRKSLFHRELLDLLYSCMEKQVSKQGT